MGVADLAFVLSLLAGASHAKVGYSHLVLPGQAQHPARPVWPEQYQVNWTFSLPYVKRLQSVGLVYNNTIYQDTKHGRQLLLRDGVEGTLEFIDTNTMYQIYPRIDRLGCRKGDIDSGAGPTAANQAAEQQASAVPTGLRPLELEDKPHPHLAFVLPDIMEKRWQFNGTVLHNGQRTDVWQWQLDSDEGWGDYLQQYAFYVTQEGVPVELHMWGTNLYTGGHYDEYIATYTHFNAGPIDEDVWALPDACQHPEELQQHHRAASLQREAAAVAPNRHYGDPEYDAFVHQHGRRHFRREEYVARREVFAGNKQWIQEQSRQGGSRHSLGLNHFGDWSHQEYLRTMLPNRGRARPPLVPAGQAVNVHKPSVPEHMLPGSIDWRGSGAESPVKDQAACGSCWAFGSVGTAETAYFRATGRQALLSEQHMMDCAWDTGNTACLGGFQNLGFEWLFKHGVLDAEEQYPYQGVSNYCRNVSSQAVHLRGNFTIVDGSDYGLREALLTKGPMTVSVDASPKSFMFYKSGVYSDPECRSDLKDLDHAVFASGYGISVDAEGEQEAWWLVRNTWATAWGEDGYIRIAMKDKMCGIATQPMYVDLDLQQ